MKFKSGDLVDFNYSGRYARKVRGGGFETHRVTTIHDYHPYALVLYWGNDIVHCVNTNYFKRNELLSFFEFLLGYRINKDNYDEVKNISNIDIGNPKSFYHNRLKAFLKRTTLGAYRTYIPSKIQSIGSVTIGDIFDWAGIIL